MTDTRPRARTIEVRLTYRRVLESARCFVCGDDLVPTHLWGEGYEAGELEDFHDVDCAECALGSRTEVLCLDCYQTLANDPTHFAARWAKLVVRSVAAAEKAVETWRNLQALEWEAVPPEVEQLEGQEVLL